MTSGRKSCRGECERENWKYGAQTTRFKRHVYARGYKSCKVCEIFIKGFTECPCCGLTLKKAPRNTKHRRVLNAKIGVVAY